MKVPTRRHVAAAVASLLRAAPLALALSLVPACKGTGASPVSPTGFIPAGDTFLIGWVHDPVSRPVSGATVEIISGPRAGRRTITDTRGSFAFDGGPTGSVTLQASRVDFATTTATTHWSTNPNEAARVVLNPLEPPWPIEPGTYEMTLTSDPSATGWFSAPCEGFPPELRRRTFAATITTATQFEGLNVNFTGPTLLPSRFGFGFDLRQAGRFVGFELEPSFHAGPWEVLPGHRYLTIHGNAPAPEPAMLNGATLTIPFWGTFEYCRLTEPMSHNACNQVPAALRLEHFACTSQRDQMVLTRR